MPSYLSAASRDGDITFKLPKRANTTPSSSNPEAVINHGQNEVTDALDAFESGNHSDNEENVEPTRGSVELDDLPIELITVTDRYAYSSISKPSPPEEGK